MKCYAIVGAKKAGKTTLAKKLVKAMLPGDPGRLMVFDKNREWGHPLRTMAEFIEEARKARGRVIVWEDATIFFSTTGRNEGLLDVMTAARHTRNTSLLLFHSLRSVPLYVLDQLDGVFILPTRDLPDKVTKRFGDWPDVVEAWQEVQAEGWANGVRTRNFPSRFVPL